MTAGSSWLPYLLGASAGVSTYAGGLLTLRFGRRRDLVFGLTGGMVVGLALLDLLPEALAAGAAAHGMQAIFATVAAGVALYLAAHRLPGGSAAGRATLLAHSLMDGLGIGLAFELSDATGWLVAAAVLAHDMADGANMVGLSTLSTGGRTQRWLTANAAAPLLGVAIGQMLPIDAAGLSLLLALFAGGFLYLGAAELLPRSRTGPRGYASGVASVAGIGIMAAIVHFAG